MPARASEDADELDTGEFYLAMRPEGNDFACDDYDDPHDYVHETAGKVVLAGYSGRTLAEIGVFKVIQVDGDGLLAQGISIHDAFDQYQETFEYYEELVEGPIPWGFNSMVLEALNCEDEILPLGMVIISDLYIEPEFRGREFGLRALKCLIQRFRIGAGLVVMRPYAPQFGASPASIEKHGLAKYKGSEGACTLKLRSHFGRLGFRLIPGTNVMALTTIAKLENVELEFW